MRHKFLLAILIVQLLIMRLPWHAIVLIVLANNKAQGRLPPVYPLAKAVQAFAARLVCRTKEKDDEV